MKTIKIPYYTSSLDLHIEEENLEAVITAKTDEYVAEKSEAELVKEALANPIGTPRLKELAKGKKKVTLVTASEVCTSTGVTGPACIVNANASRHKTVINLVLIVIVLFTTKLPNLFE